MTDEEDIIADFVGEKKVVTSKKVVIEDTDYSDPGIQVYWMEVVGGRTRVLGAKIVPIPESISKSGSASISQLPGMERELVMRESMPTFLKFIEAAGKNPADFIFYLDSNAKSSGYVFSQKIYELTTTAIEFFLQSMLDKVKNEGDSKRVEETEKTTTSTMS